MRSARAVSHNAFDRRLNRPDASRHVAFARTAARVPAEGRFRPLQPVAAGLGRPLPQRRVKLDWRIVLDAWFWVPAVLVGLAMTLPN